MEESAIEPLNEEDARMVEDQAGEENALKTKRQPRRPSEQEIAAHEAEGHYPYRDWCRACVSGAGRSDAHKRYGDDKMLVVRKSAGFLTTERCMMSCLRCVTSRIPMGLC